MESYKREFIEFMVDSQVLKFGEFTLKSGRKSPFFMNAGGYVTGTQLRKLGEYYAKAIHDNYGLDFDVLFGPAYKGIPLSVATAMAISELYGKDVRYCSNRKEAKDHGETGILLGSQLKDGDLRGDDRGRDHLRKIHRGDLSDLKGPGRRKDQGAHRLLKPHGEGKGRQERAGGSEGAVRFPTAAIVSMADVVEHLYNHEYKGKVIINDELKAAIDAYYEQYGAK